MASVILASPPLHGQLGALDEMLLFCLPVVIAIVVLAFTSRRARTTDERTRTRRSSQGAAPAEVTDSDRSAHN